MIDLALAQTSGCLFSEQFYVRFVGLQGLKRKGEWHRGAVDGRVGICVRVAIDCEKRAVNLIRCFTRGGRWCGKGRV